MNPEEKARQKIDAMLIASGWAVQTKEKTNLFAQRGVALCELTFKTGEPDCTLFVDAKAIGTIEAKPAGTTLTEAEEQVCCRHSPREGLVEVAAPVLLRKHR